MTGLQGFFLNMPTIYQIMIICLKLQEKPFVIQQLSLNPSTVERFFGEF